MFPLLRYSCVREIDIAHINLQERSYLLRVWSPTWLTSIWIHQTAFDVSRYHRTNLYQNVLVNKTSRCNSPCVYIYLYIFGVHTYKLMNVVTRPMTGNVRAMASARESLSVTLFYVEFLFFSWRFSTESFRKCRLKDSRKGGTQVDTRFSDFLFFPHQAVLRRKADIIIFSRRVG